MAAVGDMRATTLTPAPALRRRRFGRRSFGHANDNERLSRRTLVQRALIAADVIGLAIAFVVAETAYGDRGPLDRLPPLAEFLVFLATLPGWVVVAKLYRLYDHDD